MGNPVTSKVVTTLDGRSSELQSRHRCIDTIGRLAARCPCGEQARGEVASGARQQIPAHLANQRGRVYCRLMMERWQDAHSRLPADGSLDGREVAGTQPDHKTREGRSGR
jgi:hypothetical protein